MLLRRTFLQLAGATAGLVAFNPLYRALAGFERDFYHGRTLGVAAVYPSPKLSTSPIQQLWPDSIVQIIDQQHDWYQIGQGWVARADIQPMPAYIPDTVDTAQTPPFWAEVAAAVAPVRDYCAADAPLVTRIGHGGTARIVDYLPGEPNGWYAVADEHSHVLGWTQAVFWRPTRIDSKSGVDCLVHLDRTHYLVSAYERDKLVVQAPFSTPNVLRAGLFPIVRGKITSHKWGDFYGAAWETVFGDEQTLVGVYWHNDFGHPVAEGPSIQVSPLLARWVYGWLGDDAHVLVE